MKLFEKYNKSRLKEYVITIVTEIEEGSMAFVNRHVSEAKVKAIVITLIRSQVELQTI